jgi:hypothetical protein
MRDHNSAPTAALRSDYALKLDKHWVQMKSLYCSQGTALSQQPVIGIHATLVDCCVA